MKQLGTKAEDFTLVDTVSKEKISYSDITGEHATVIMFICNHCPFVKHVQEELVNLANNYLSKGVGFVAISSNDVENYPQDSPEKMREEAKKNNYPFPYLYDKSQEVAKKYQAACTPDFFVYDKNDSLVYRGQLDESRPGNDKPVNGSDLRAALDAILAGKKPTTNQKPSIGCNIKWKET